jgi:hypothetical protein
LLAQTRNVRVCNLLLTAELAFPLRRLLGENVAHVRMAGFEPAIAFRAETLCSAALGFQLRHDFLLFGLARSSVAFGWAGGPAPVAAKALDTRTLDSFDRL